MRNLVRLANIFGSVTVAVATFVLIARRVLIWARVSGDSMIPTFYRGDYVFGVRVPNRSAYGESLIRYFLIQVGAVALVRPPAHLGRLEVKRIDGLPGDLREWGWHDLHSNRTPVPKGYVFLTGDGSRHYVSSSDRSKLPPQDSRLYGPCPTSAIVARVVLAYSPRTGMRRIPRCATSTSSCTQ